MKKIVFATTNINKLKEIKKYLPNDIEVLSLLDFPNHLDVEEPFLTFEENALHKAKSFYDLEKIPVIAEDSGIIVDCLDNKYYIKGFEKCEKFPSVLSARYASLVLNNPELDHDYSANNALLLKEMENVKGFDRSARYVSIFCFYDGEKPRYFQGTLEGFIAYSEKGTNGFAYDSILIPADKNSEGGTYAEMDDESKQKQSHRIKALDLTMDFINTYLG